MPEHDVVVVGGGFAGMRAAITAKAAGVDAALVSKVYPIRSHSSGAHSGINAALSSEDSWESHASDTIEGGAHLSDQDAVETMCRDGIDDVISLEHMGVIFSRDDNGRIDVMPFGGSSHPRTCYVGDSAGHIILQVLYEQLLRWSVKTYDEWFVSSLLVDEGVCKGVIAQELSTGSIHKIDSKSVILATGGIGRMYQPSTAAYTSTADGQALAYRAGVPLMDMEMIQYHPTSLEAKGVLITEAARGVGAVLVNKDGQAFMEASDPERMDLSTRDVMARAVFNEAGKNGNGPVSLDFRHLEQGLIDDRLAETKFLVDRLTGVDIRKDLVPVEPAMHRPLGGVQVDSHGATSLPGLYAAGECACVGVHGANNLGGNVLLESIVFGRRAGEAASEYSMSTQSQNAPLPLLDDEVSRFAVLAGRNGTGDSVGSIQRELAEAMHQKVGLFRNAEALTEAGKKIDQLTERYSKLGIASVDGPYNPSLCSYLELENMLEVSKVIVASVLARQESRGVHYRIDFPERDDDNWMQHTLASHTPEGPELAYRPVVITTWQLQRRSG